MTVNDDINSRDILLDQKVYKNMLFYNISCKPFIVLKPLRVRFDERDGFIKRDVGIDI